MLAGMLEAAGRRVVHNRAGSNLVRGISAAFAEQMSPFGAGDAEIGVVESDELAFPDVVRRVQPRVVLLLNLFRDQLDRYGELETIASHWRAALAALDAGTTLVVNADDPTLAALALESAATVVTFGLEEAGWSAGAASRGWPTTRSTSRTSAPTAARGAAFAARGSTSPAARSSWRESSGCGCASTTGGQASVRTRRWTWPCPAYTTPTTRWPRPRRRVRSASASTTSPQPSAPFAQPSAGLSG
jgi:UDP-N-acetylmuramyl tripeptide synthase